MKDKINVERGSIQTDTTWRIIGQAGDIKTIHLDNINYHFLKMKRTDSSGKLQTELLYGQIKPILQYLGYSLQEMANLLEVNPSTLSRWRKGDKPIGKMRSKTMYELDKIITKGIRIFGSEVEFKKWLNSDNYALGDRKPVEMLKDPYGLELVDNAIEAISWGNVI